MEQENKFRLHKLIQLGIYSTIVEDLDLNYWIEECYKMQKLEPHPEKKSNRGGWQSRNNLHEEKSFWPLTRTLQNEYSNILDDPTQVITGLWLNISSYTNWNSSHNHVSLADYYPYIKFSGVLYLKTPLNSGEINFKNPLNPNSYIKILPQEKMMIIFPSILEHYVEPNLNQEDRISIAFNMYN